MLSQLQKSPCDSLLQWARLRFLAQMSKRVRMLIRTRSKQAAPTDDEYLYKGMIRLCRFLQPVIKHVTPQFGLPERFHDLQSSLDYIKATSTSDKIQLDHALVWLVLATIHRFYKKPPESQSTMFPFINRQFPDSIATDWYPLTLIPTDIKWKQFARSGAFGFWLTNLFLSLSGEELIELVLDQPKHAKDNRPRPYPPLLYMWPHRWLCAYDVYTSAGEITMESRLSMQSAYRIHLTLENAISRNWAAVWKNILNLPTDGVWRPQPRHWLPLNSISRVVFDPNDNRYPMFEKKPWWE